MGLGLPAKSPERAKRQLHLRDTTPLLPPQADTEPDIRAQTNTAHKQLAAVSRTEMILVFFFLGESGWEKFSLKLKICCFLNQ